MNLAHNLEMGYNQVSAGSRILKSNFRQGCLDMPAISMFYGLVVYMYYLDNRQHKLPHIHVKYQNDEVVVSVPDGLVLEG